MSPDPRLIRELRRQLEALEVVLRDLQALRTMVEANCEQAERLRDHYVDVIRAALTEETP